MKQAHKNTLMLIFKIIIIIIIIIIVVIIIVYCRLFFGTPCITQGIEDVNNQTIKQRKYAFSFFIFFWKLLLWIISLKHFFCKTRSKRPRSHFLPKRSVFPYVYPAFYLLCNITISLFLFELQAEEQKPSFRVALVKKIYATLSQ